MKWNFVPNIPAAMANIGHTLSPSDGADIARGEADIPSDSGHQTTLTVKTEVSESEKPAAEVPLTDGSIDTVVTTGAIEEGEIIVVCLLFQSILYPVPQKMFDVFFRISSVCRNVETKGKVFWK